MDSKLHQSDKNVSMQLKLRGLRHALACLRLYRQLQRNVDVSAVMPHGCQCGTANYRLA